MNGNPNQKKENMETAPKRKRAQIISPKKNDNLYSGLGSALKRKISITESKDEKIMLKSKNFERPAIRIKSILRNKKQDSKENLKSPPVSTRQENPLPEIGGLGALLNKLKNKKNQIQPSDEINSQDKKPSLVGNFAAKFKNNSVLRSFKVGNKVKAFVSVLKKRKIA